PKAYLEQTRLGSLGNVIQEEHEIARSELGFEFMLNALRLNAGFEPNLFAERTGIPLNVIEKALNDAEVEGLLYRDHQVIKPTVLGGRFLNDLQEMFLQD
ncbi:MAG: oxygen-independent coproporphyrinogen III oxidase-like protein, partial [Glaciimonas sp.]|nr:oxygen-independent coproporphyrinogen III oxidase-like protein [Glaciimonas sp.]